jgi:nitrate/nitrite-specific signal transduction histidine kinase
MRERAQRIDATLEITSESAPAAARGTVVQVTVAGRSPLTDEGLIAHDRSAE